MQAFASRRAIAALRLVFPFTSATCGGERHPVPDYIITPLFRISQSEILLSSVSTRQPIETHRLAFPFAPAAAEAGAIPVQAIASFHSFSK